MDHGCWFIRQLWQAHICQRSSSLPTVTCLLAEGFALSTSTCTSTSTNNSTSTNANPSTNTPANVSTNSDWMLTSTTSESASQKATCLIFIPVLQIVLWCFFFSLQFPFISFLFEYIFVFVFEIVRCQTKWRHASLSLYFAARWYYHLWVVVPMLGCRFCAPQYPQHPLLYPDHTIPTSVTKSTSSYNTIINQPHHTMCAPAWWCQLMVPHIFLTASDGCGRTREEHLGMLTSVGRTKHQTPNTKHRQPNTKKQRPNTKCRKPNTKNEQQTPKAKNQNNNANTNHNQILIVLAFSECF